MLIERYQFDIPSKYNGKKEYDINFSGLNTPLFGVAVQNRNKQATYAAPKEVNI